MVIQALKWENGVLKLIDQTKLPLKTEYLYLMDYQDVADAIKKLKVRGAPAIGIAAAYGVCLGANQIRETNQKKFADQLMNVIDELAATRPTAVNLFWALDRMKTILSKNLHLSIEELRMLLQQEADNIAREDEQMCQKIGEHGAALLRDGDVVITHCNTGALATGGIGTALGIIYTAANQGKKIKVFADETRPLLQGARLTTFELMHAGIDVTLICDDMAAFVMKRKQVDAVLVGADRIARNGDTANKIGTYNLAIAAKYHQVPFYVVAPSSTIDMSLKNGGEIPIEERNPAEVTHGFGKQTAPDGVAVYNPAFDVTPADLISAIVTEKGIFRYPYDFRF